MNIIDDLESIKLLDKSGILESVDNLPYQMTSAISSVKDSNVEMYSDIANVCISGMGGSGLGAHIMKSLFITKLPIEIINSYHVPSFVGKNTLFIACSYSGSTEETVSSLIEAKERGAQIYVITTGGELERFAHEQNIPSYIFTKEFNPSNQPRMASGYLLMGLVTILQKLNIVDIDMDLLQKYVSQIKSSYPKIGVEFLTQENIAKEISSKLYGRIPVIFAAEFLSGIAHLFANQINENAKIFSSYFLLSELNHHLLEGLGLESHKDDLYFILLNSQHYSERIKQRVKITKSIIEKNNFKCIEIDIIGNSTYSTAFNAMYLNSYISVYLALSENIDPSPVPWVDYIKSQLSQM